MRIPGRDFIGYAGTPPHARWPEAARVAVNFCLNYEDGAELCILNGDDRSETRLSDVATETRIGSRDLTIESSYEYVARVGYWRLMRAFTERRLPCTVNLVGVAAEANPLAVADMVKAGFDLQLHGWRWIDQASLCEEVERDHIQRQVVMAAGLTGALPLGYHAGLPSINTRRLLVEAGTFLYDSDVCNDDLPYWSADYPGHLLVPSAPDTSDSRFARTDGAFRLGGDFATYVCDSFDQLHAEGARRPQMMTVDLHPRLLGRPGRIGALHRILDHMMARPDVWICRRGDLAEHWAREFPDPRLR